jgi:hypothetical protein
MEYFGIEVFIIRLEADFSDYFHPFFCDPET